MVKPTRFAPHICAICTVLVFLGITLGLGRPSPLIMVVLLLPTVVYEAYQTKGKPTKATLFLLLAILLAEIFLIFFGVDSKSAEFLRTDQQEPLLGCFPSASPLTRLIETVVVVVLMIMAVLSIVLLVRTKKTYIRCLVVIMLIIVSLIIVYNHYFSGYLAW